MQRVSLVVSSPVKKFDKNVALQLKLSQGKISKRLKKLRFVGRRRMIGNN
jgi:hypothetical protein